jgi:hypothetical protein
MPENLPHAAEVIEDSERIERSARVLFLAADAGDRTEDRRLILARDSQMMSM